MLFLVLFYVYPLKFLFNLSVTSALFSQTPKGWTGLTYMILLPLLRFSAVIHHRRRAPFVAATVQ